MVALAVHPVSVAATRLRTMQYEPHLAEEGMQLRLWSFFAEKDLTRWYGRSQLARVLVVLRGLLRLPAAVREVMRADVVIVQRECLPLGPPVLEWLAGKLRPMVWDVDDSIWVQYVSPTAGRIPGWLRAPAGKYRRICGWATEVWPGSEVLAGWCREHSGSVTVVPTVVPVPATPPTLVQSGGIAWIGSHSTAVFLDEVLVGLAAAHITRRVYVVGGQPRVPRGLDLELLPWSPEVESQVLAASRVGLYPVDRDHPLAEGKCGLKAILYMAHGIPSVVTPTTTNAVVVRDGVDGWHAETAAEWSDCVRRLLDDDALAARMSAAAHRRAAEEYSLQVWGPKVAARLLLLDRRTALGSR